MGWNDISTHAHDWVEKVKGDLSSLVGRHTTDCQRDPAKMLALAHLLRKCAATIEEDIAANGPNCLPEDAPKAKLPAKQESKVAASVAQAIASNGLPRKGTVRRVVGPRDRTIPYRRPAELGF